ncbi:MAG: hypothetical protein ACRCYY_19075 [Trueperaceae bacterium]
MNSFFHIALEYLGYTLSLPERAVRSLAALVGGSTELLVKSLLPESLRGTTTYRVTVGLFQKFLVERMAGMEEKDATTATGQLKDKFVQRKLVGNVLEAAGLLTMRFSPLWVLAIAGDAASGSKTFLERLVKHLKANGVIPENAQPKELVDVLEAVQNATEKSATALDQPPLSRDELAQLADEMKESYSKILTTSADLIPDLTKVWADMEEVSKKEKVSLETLMGMMVFEAASFVGKGVSTVTAVGKTGVELFDETIVQSYKKTLGRVSVEGVDGYLANHFQPFVEAAKGHFDIEKKTWLELKLTGST